MAQSSQKIHFLKTKTFTANHSSRFLDKLNNDRLLNRSGLCDFVISVGESNERVHKVVLAMFSNYFFQAFKEKKEENINVDLQGLDTTSVKNLIDFMYTSQITIARETVLNLTAAADFLEIEDVKQFCRDFVDGFFSNTPLKALSLPSPSQPIPDSPGNSPHWQVSIISDQGEFPDLDESKQHEETLEELLVEPVSSFPVTDSPELKPCTSREAAQPYSYSPLGFDMHNDDNFWRLDHHLPFETFLSAKYVFQLLMDPNVEYLPAIPDGVKENCYFVVENMDNVMRHKAGVPRRFMDDSGPWGPAHQTVVFGWLTEGRILQLSRNRGKYCLRRNGAFHECKPQPGPRDVVKAGKILMSHKLNCCYRRKITWLYTCWPECKPVCVVEYRGKYPGPNSLPELVVQ